jgi:type I restriction enzyme, S subunit
MNLPPLPSHWKVARICDLAENRQHALTIGPFGSDLKTSDYRDSGVPIVFVRDVQPNSFRPKQRQYVSEQKARELAAHVVRPGDLVVTKMGLPPCVAAVYPDSEPPGIVTADIIKFSVDDAKLDRKYAAYFLNTEFAKKQIAGITFGITRPKVTLRDFKEMRLPLPPLSEQRRIAEVLYRVEALQAKRRDALARLTALMDAIFLEMFGDSTKNPMGWKVLPVGEVSEVQGGLQISSMRARHPNSVPYLRVANVGRGTLDLREIKRLRATDAEIARTALKRDDLLIVEGHGNPEEIGRCALWDGSISRCVHQNHLIRVRFNKDYVVPLYACVYLNSVGGRSHLLRAGKTTSGLNTISVSDVRSAPLGVPPLPLQREFAQRIKSVARLRASQRASLAELDALFASLQHRAFRGEL